ncbi:MAG: hypothetical protein AAFZ15_19680 [Bacteroidota bacterium]
MEHFREYPVSYFLLATCIFIVCWQLHVYSSKNNTGLPMANPANILFISNQHFVSLRGTPVLEKAHSHNDYEQGQPLLHALSLGFKYIEVDVFKIGNELYVSHFYPLFPDKKRRSGRCTCNRWPPSSSSRAVSFTRKGIPFF